MELLDQILTYDIGVAGAWILYLIRLVRTIRKERNETQARLDEVNAEFRDATEQHAKEWHSLIRTLQGIREQTGPNQTHEQM